MHDKTSPNKSIKHENENKTETDTQKINVLFYPGWSPSLSLHEHTRIIFSYFPACSSPDTSV